MQTPFDQLAKAILGVLLRHITDLEPAREISSHVQIADVWVESIHGKPDELARLGTLGRMIAQGPCLLEPFSQAPGVSEIRACLCKQYALAQELARNASGESQAEPCFPRQWVISAGHPESVIQAMELQAMPGWPEGFWQGRPFDAFHVVVVRALPVTAETLFLRMLGRGATFAEAIRELKSRPTEDWAARVLVPVLVAFRYEFPQDLMEEEPMEALQHFETVYAQWEKKVRNEGHKKGLDEGLEKGLDEGHKKGLDEGHKKGLDEGLQQGEEKGERAGILEGIEALCRVLGLELSAERKQQLASADLPTLRETLAHLTASRTWPAP